MPGGQGIPVFVLLFLRGQSSACYVSIEDGLLVNTSWRVQKDLQAKQVPIVDLVRVGQRSHVNFTVATFLCVLTETSYPLWERSCGNEAVSGLTTSPQRLITKSALNPNLTNVWIWYFVHVELNGERSCVDVFSGLTTSTQLHSQGNKEFDFIFFFTVSNVRIERMVERLKLYCHLSHGRNWLICK